MNRPLAALAFALAFFGATRAYAFPELVRHGYVNCTACHVSPTGGGALTPYGRSLSREVLSTWGTESETNFAYFMKDAPEWVIPGGDIRSVYTYRNTPAVEEGKWIFMQGDAEAYGNYKDKLFFGGTLGYERKKRVSDYQDKFVTRRHWVNYRPMETVSLRTGKFYPAFGINTPDHIIATKRGLGWDEGMETYNMEAAYLGETWNAYLTGIFGRIDDTSIVRDRGMSAVASYSFLETYKAGLSYFYGGRSGVRRHVAGPWAILGFTHHFYLLTETDFEWKTPDAASTPRTHGLVTYNKLGYEVLQGLHFFFSEEFFNLDLRTNNSRGWAHTLGSQWFPRPHFEFLLAWQKQLTAALPGKYTDLGYFQFHFYF